MGSTNTKASKSMSTAKKTPTAKKASTKSVQSKGSPGKGTNTVKGSTKY